MTPAGTTSSGSTWSGATSTPVAGAKWWPTVAKGSTLAATTKYTSTEGAARSGPLSQHFKTAPFCSPTDRGRTLRLGLHNVFKSP